MKKILYISPSDPEYTNGGAISAKKNLKILLKLKEEKKIELYEVISKEKEMMNQGKYFYEVKRKKYKAYISRILGFAEQLELESKKILEIINTKKIEVVIFQTSRLGNISEKIKKKFPMIKIIQCFDNFEYEFSKMFTKNMNTIIKKIELSIVKKTEEKAVKNMDLGLFLTQKDSKSIENFYKYERKSKIVPIFYENDYNETLKIEKKNQVIFTGSLDMEANIEAALFLIMNYEKIFEKNEYDLIIAGRNPDKRLEREILNRKKIKIISNPSKDKMEKLMRESLFYISPVFDGSGMKTKFVEAIFHGLPIVASEHTMIGYDFFEQNKIEFVEIFKDRDLENLKIHIEKIKINLKNDNLTKKIRKFYYETFSEKRIFSMIEEAINEV